jgi:phosphoribosylformylglycinamidine cyclo-ligase
MTIDYKKAGVDIDKGNQFVTNIKNLVKGTAREGSNPDIGGFGGLFDLQKCGFKNPILVSCNDGVGTKVKLTQKLNKYDTIGIDLVAMSVNDLVVQNAEPLFFLDYFSCGKLDLEIGQEIIKGITDGCKQANCALIGGETAEMPAIYKSGDYDLAGFCVGAAEKEDILPKNNIISGDVILGMASNGIHSNGFSLINKIISDQNIDLNQDFGDNQTIGTALLKETKIYVKSCLAAAKTDKIKAFAHITGGGMIENIMRIIPENLNIEIDFSAWDRPEIFQFLQETANIAEEEMRRVFNCGIGMVAICKEEDISEISDILIKEGEKVTKIGQVK